MRDTTGRLNPNWRGGKFSHPLYHIYKQMVYRCTRPDHPQWDRYGGRGISVCGRWREDFWNFVDDMGPRPEGRTSSGKRPAYVLDRIDNDGGYEPGNCRWADQTTSMMNRSITPGHPCSSMTHCVRGHPFDEDNTYVTPTGARQCRVCLRRRARETRARAKTHRAKESKA